MPGIVLHNSKTVYWPVPKNMCTTLKIYVANLLGLPIEGSPHQIHFEFTDVPIVGYRNFGVVRNPYKRLYSLWVNKIADGHPEAPDFINGIDPGTFSPKLRQRVSSGMPFDDFVNIILNSEERNPHWATQCEQFPHQCEFVKLEHVAPFTKTFFQSLNPSHLQDDWKTAYSKKSLKLATQYYDLDFKRFNYARFPNKILVDCDGVLTDGRSNIDHNGEKIFKSFHTRDIRAIRELVFNGYEVTIVSVDDWPGIFHFAEKVGADVHICREKNGFPYGEYIAIGDDAWDVQMLKEAEIAFVPSDADPSVKAVKDTIVLETAGGRGVMAEVCRRLLQ